MWPGAVPAGLPFRPFAEGREIVGRIEQRVGGDGVAVAELDVVDERRAAPIGVRIGCVQPRLGVVDVDGVAEQVVRCKSVVVLQQVVRRGSPMTSKSPASR